MLKDWRLTSHALAAVHLLEERSLILAHPDPFPHDHIPLSLSLSCFYVGPIQLRTSCCFWLCVVSLLSSPLLLPPSPSPPSLHPGPHMPCSIPLFFCIGSRLFQALSPLSSCRISGR